MAYRPFSRSRNRVHSMASAMSAARQALNRQLGADRIVRPPMPIDEKDLPPQRTILEAKANNAPFRVMRMVQRFRSRGTRAEFHAGTVTHARAVRLASSRPDRSIVVAYNNEIIYDNDKPIATE